MQKFGYNGYVFNPEDWVVNGTKRLSTCYGRYKQQQYGSMTRERILGLFNDFCSHEVVWLDNAENTQFLCVSNSSVSYEWMNNNISGYWRDLSFADFAANNQILGLFKSGVRFEKYSDAVLFKLVWVS
ncbi:MAG: hypothetical protein HC836_44585 [Richelia sp. RM2_1_2]|nr:hypothetical protein [Richelia sp. RM2_1_2]